MPKGSQQPKERLTGLDGLRGLAALSVFFGHSDFKFSILNPYPIALFLYHVFASGIVGVQILFVLSGFLMSLLYPAVIDKLAFWQKRYTRIFPVFIVIACFIWYANQAESGDNWSYKLLILLTCAWVLRTLWLSFRRLPQNQEKNWGRKVFLIFLGLQALFMCINLFVTPRFVTFHQLHLPPRIQDLLLLFSNLTLTAPFASGVPWVTGGFWSLTPEVIFYLLYPIIVLPMVRLGRRSSWIVSLLLIIGVTKIVFDLQEVFLGIGGLHLLKISRVTGFMVGVVIGTLHQQQQHQFLQFKKLSNRFLPSVLILAVFMFILWLNNTTQLGASAYTLNWFHLVSSWSIGFVVIALLTPQGILHRFFSHHIFTFLGMISYSFYLIHFNVVCFR